MKRTREDNRKKLIFTAVVFTAVTILNLLILLRHETWRDEAQAWMIARDTGVFGVMDVLSYEGHPALWYYILMPFARFGAPFCSIYFINFVIASASLWLFLWFAPFSMPTKAIIAFSPVFVYTFAVDARSYCTCSLLMTAVAIVYAKRDQKPLLYGLLLALLIQTHIILAGMVFIFSLMWLIETVQRIRRDGVGSAVKQIIGLFLPLLSALLLLYEFRDVFSAHEVANPMRMPSNLTPRYLILLAGAVIGAVVIVLLRRLIKNTHTFKILILLSVSLMWPAFIFLTLYPIAETKIVVCLYILFVCAWIAHEDGVIRLSDNRCLSAVQVGACVAVICLLFVIVVTKGYENARDDIRYLYSDSSNAAEFINNSLDEDAVIVTNTGDFCNGVLVKLKDGRKVYSPLTMETASFENRDNRLEFSLTYDEFIDRCRRMFPDTSEIYVLYAFDNRIAGLEEVKDHSELLYHTSAEPVVKKEYFSIFKMKL